MCVASQGRDSQFSFKDLFIEEFGVRATFSASVSGVKSTQVALGLRGSADYVTSMCSLVSVTVSFVSGLSCS